MVKRWKRKDKIKSKGYQAHKTQYKCKWIQNVLWQGPQTQMYLETFNLIANVYLVKNSRECIL